MSWRALWLSLTLVVWITWSIAMIAMVYGDRSAVFAVVLITPVAVAVTASAVLETYTVTPTPIGKRNRDV